MFTGFIVASGGVLSDGYGHGGPGVCLGDCQTEAYLKDMGMAGLVSAIPDLTCMEQNQALKLGRCVYRRRGAAAIGKASSWYHTESNWNSVDAKVGFGWCLIRPS